jgi:ribonuclease HI
MVVAIIPHVQIAILSRDQTWSFALATQESGGFLEATEDEPDWSADRLTLLALVRGLESLDLQSHVEVVTASRHVFHGLCYGLENWRDEQWRWESFGLLVPVKNADLWQRIDRALNFHDLESVRLCSEREIETDIVGWRSGVDILGRQTDRQRRAPLRIHHLRHVLPARSHNQVSPLDAIQAVA